MEQQRKVKAQCWLRNLRILLKEQRQETIRTKGEQFEQ